MNTPLRIISLSLISAMGLAACEPAYLQDPNQNRTRDGAVIGGMLGAFLGATADDDNRGRNAVLGAAAGALVGGAIGHSLDQQAADLRASMANESIVIDNRGDHLMVTMPDGILFDTDSAAIRAGLQADLRAMARNLQQYPASTVDVIGHTDNIPLSGRGRFKNNFELSVARAQSVADVLTVLLSNPDRLEVDGRGEDEPIASNADEAGRSLNRRVEVQCTG